MRVLVTGGAGYIGSTAAAILIERGHQVTVLDDLSTGNREYIPAGARFVQGSLLEKGALHQALNEVDAVLHFAAKSLVGESVERPEIYWLNNVMGTRNLLDQMREFSIKKLVLSSSAATYGEPSEVPIMENSATKPTNPYGASKLAMDLMVTGESTAYKLAAISLRYFNVAGAYQSNGKWIAELHHPETHLIPNLLKSKANKPMKIFGTDWPTKDGTCIRDYIHIEDLIDAHIKALENLSSGQHEIINLGSGGGYSVKEVIAAAEKVLGRSIPVEATDRRTGDPAVLIASIEKAQKVLGWSPTKDISEMIDSAYQALKSLPELY
jgi:UDP-glucose 4-epimerase